MNLDAQSIITAETNLLATELEGETVILSFVTGEYLGLDEIGSIVWKQIQQPTSIASICTVIMAEYDVDEKQCLEDMLDLVRSLIEKKIAHVQIS